MTLEEAWKFSVFMLKAVMDRRGKKVVDTAKVNLTR
jgi:pyruvate dehydrogenase (quinone)